MKKQELAEEEKDTHREYTQIELSVAIFRKHIPKQIDVETVNKCMYIVCVHVCICVFFFIDSSTFYVH